MMRTLQLSLACKMGALEYIVRNCQGKNPRPRQRHVWCAQEVEVAMARAAWGESWDWWGLQRKALKHLNGQL